jgi:hypothetical protein
MVTQWWRLKGSNFPGLTKVGSYYVFLTMCNDNMTIKKKKRIGAGDVAQ